MAGGPGTARGHGTAAGTEATGPTNHQAAGARTTSRRAPAAKRTNGTNRQDAQFGEVSPSATGANW
jgi:hypothetical protein